MIKKLDARVVVGGLIVVGGILWLIFHLGNNSGLGLQGTAPDPSQQDSYPNAGTTLDAGSIPLPDSPPALTYNIGFPSSGLASVAPSPSGSGSGCSCDSGCGSPAIIQSVQPVAVPQSLMDSQTANLASVGTYFARSQA